MPVVIPPSFLALARRGGGFATWLDRLPAPGSGAARGVAADAGRCAGPRSRRARGAGPLRWRPARRAQVGWPHWEAEHEHLALQHWGGEGAVRLLRADPPGGAPPRAPAPRGPGRPRGRRACEVVASLYRRLHVPAPPQLVTLSSCVRGGPTRWVRSRATRRCRAGWSSRRRPWGGRWPGRGHRRPAAAHRPALRERARR